VSNWLLVIVFSCLIAYLSFPGPLDQVSFVLWPAEMGIYPAAQVSFTVGGTTTYPGIVSLNITITNVDVIAHDYAILALIGINASPSWWGPGFYMDNLTPATDVQNITRAWYSQAFITTGSLNPGQSFQVTRKIKIENSGVKDALVVLYNTYDAGTELARRLKLNVINQ
jgi:hypothetical protein